MPSWFRVLWRCERRWARMLGYWEAWATMWGRWAIRYSKSRPLEGKLTQGWVFSPLRGCCDLGSLNSTLLSLSLS